MKYRELKGVAPPSHGRGVIGKPFSGPELVGDLAIVKPEGGVSCVFRESLLATGSYMAA